MADVSRLDLSDTFGVVFWGFVIATTCFGVSITQCYLYFKRNKDGPSFRAFVASMMIMDFATTALAAQSLHYYLVANYGNAGVLAFMTKCAPSFRSLGKLNILSSYQDISSGVLHHFGSHPWVRSSAFPVLPIVNLQRTSHEILEVTMDICCHRKSLPVPEIVVRSRRNWFKALLAMISFASSAVQLRNLIVVHRDISKLHETILQIPIAVANGSAAACDIISTISLIVFVTSHAPSRKEIKSLVTYVIFLAVGRGFLVAVAQVGLLAMFFGSPASKFYWMPFHLNISKLHVNTTLAMLNSRASLRSKATHKHIRSENARSQRFKRTIGSSDLPRSRDWTTDWSSVENQIDQSCLPYRSENLQQLLDSSISVQLSKDNDVIRPKPTWTGESSVDSGSWRGQGV
ncbi:uncharacterized protein FOMMEDRAFT_150934 [Fomitiporia mediterranea MF3/22]|uniref:uncharacterized protein n=1 Tax=Fomitiporia mediterranea (strain MF3/22) TaxID=694068 RepID=UPI000440960A|nr:uncharacterized protein FOMMEDRAFT_150934 [Fomitiporia mediterranea MF3/22]EJD08215.1 hypothetical protein FOMMEDRAFT_150934 [Fomitiporia mediterranea MF3/22]